VSSRGGPWYAHEPLLDASVRPVPAACQRWRALRTELCSWATLPFLSTLIPVEPNRPYDIPLDPLIRNAVGSEARGLPTLTYLHIRNAPCCEQECVHKQGPTTELRVVRLHPLTLNPPFLTLNLLPGDAGGASVCDLSGGAAY
jgi:hypothetical protein